MARMGMMTALAAEADPRAIVLDRLRELASVDAATLTRAEQISARTGQAVEQVLNQLGSLSDDDLVDLYAQVCGCEIWDPAARPVAITFEDLGVSAQYLRRTRLAPIALNDDVLVCAACDPLDQEALSGLVFATGRRLEVLAARTTDWRRGFDLAFAAAITPGPADERRLEREIDQAADTATDGVGGRLVAAAFEAAIASGASDIHFEPGRHGLKIRLRVDGRLIDHQTVSSDLAAPAVSRVKVIANLDLGERRLPQDGRTTFVIAGRQVDVRVATSPTVFGEAAVLRILDRSSVPLDLAKLGLSDETADVLRQAARTPHGIFLVTGPTGSGKTTTLYALLETFAGSTKKVLSIEDPVEYFFEHVSQTQVAPQLGLTFARALRSFLRQDPDVILVGEIRDPETAAVAIQAAMTGHFVLASIHANDALAVLPRMRDMGVEPYQLAAALRGASAQRLVRRLCPQCSRARASTEAERHFAASQRRHDLVLVREAVGCSACKRLGFKGRIAIGEAYLADEALLRAIADGAPLAELGGHAARCGLGSMATDGLDKVKAGLTTCDEVMAAIDG